MVLETCLSTLSSESIDTTVVFCEFEEWSSQRRFNLLEVAQLLSLCWFQIPHFAEIRDCLGHRGDKIVLAQQVVAVDAVAADTQVL